MGNRILITRSQWPILIVNVILLLFFSIFFISRKNYEFIIYVFVIIFFLSLILISNRHVRYSDISLWGLTLWAIMHMSGGSVYIGETRLYEIILVPLSSLYPVLRYDQFVHIIGFCVATMIMFTLIRPSLKDYSRKISLAIVVIMAGLGVGALNEVIEFAATVLSPQTGVGGYMNTSLDLVADLIGACIAFIIVYVKEIRKNKEE